MQRPASGLCLGGGTGESTSGSAQAVGHVPAVRERLGCRGRARGGGECGSVGDDPPHVGVRRVEDAEGVEAVKPLNEIAEVIVEVVRDDGRRYAYHLVATERHPIRGTLDWSRDAVEKPWTGLAWREYEPAPVVRIQLDVTGAPAVDEVTTPVGSSGAQAEDIDGG